MIWSEATQSDQPEITWMSRLTGLPCGSISVAALVREPVRRQQRLGRRRVVRGHRLRLGLDARVGHPLREEPVEADRVRRRCVAVLTELRDAGPVDRQRERLAERDDAVRVLRVVEDERLRIRGRRVERVEVRLVLRLVRLSDVRDEVVRPVDLTALDQCQRCVVRRRLHVLEAADQRLAGLPVVRVLREHVVLRGEASDLVERSRPDRVRVRERRRVLHLRPDVLRHDEHRVQRRRR